MSADKRTVATDALETLGMIIDASQKRDAIHLAVEPVIAGQTLAPGQDIGLVTVAGDTRAYIVKDEHRLGIVDPFLKEPVRAGERFWLIIYPRQIKSLRHVWSHPAFPDEPALADLKPAEDADKRKASEEYLRELCSGWDGPDYESLLEVATTGRAGNGSYGNSYEMDGDYLSSYGSDAHGEIPSQIWDHIEIVTGKKVVGRPEYFSCSC